MLPSAVAFAWAFSPLHLAVTNADVVTRPYRLVLAGLGLAGLGLVLYRILRWLRVPPSGAGAAASTSGLIVAFGSPLLDVIPPTVGGPWLLGLIVCAILARLGQMSATEVVLSRLLFFLVASLAALSFIEALEWGTEDLPPTSGAISLRSSTELRDVFLVVLDGHTSFPVLKEQFGYDVAPLERAYKNAGFRVVPEIRSPYAMTFASMTAIFEGEYLLQEGDQVTAAARREFYRRLGGDNRLVATLSEAGYHVTLVENGWVGLRCGPKIDECVERPVWDEGLHAVGQRSMLAPVLADLPHPFTAGALASMAWARSEVGRLAANDRRDFVYLHVNAPHEPYVLSPDCTSVTESPLELRRYLEHLECANNFALEVFGQLDDVVVIIVGDHGSQTRTEGRTPPEHWGQLDLEERLTSFLAVKAPASCDFAIEAGIDVGNRLLECLGGDTEDSGVLDVALLDWSETGEHPYRIHAVPWEPRSADEG